MPPIPGEQKSPWGVPSSERLGVRLMQQQTLKACQKQWIDNQHFEHRQGSHTANENVPIVPKIVTLSRINRDTILTTATWLRFAPKQQKNQKWTEDPA